MTAPPTHYRAARRGVPIGVHGAVPVGQQHEALGSGRQARRGGLPLLLGLRSHASAGELAQEPAHRVGSTQQHCFEQVCARHSATGSAEGAACQVARAVGPRDHGGAQVEVGRARAGDPGPQPGRLPVTQAADHRQPGRQPAGGRRLGSDPTQPRARRIERRAGVRPPGRCRPGSHPPRCAPAYQTGPSGRRCPSRWQDGRSGAGPGKRACRETGEPRRRAAGGSPAARGACPTRDCRKGACR